MNYRYGITVENPLRLSFDTYLNDKHAALELIEALDGHRMHDLLLDLYRSAPHAMAKALAIRYPWSADQADAVETATQQGLPLDWR